MQYCTMQCHTVGDEKQVSKEAIAQQAAEAHAAEIRALGDDIGVSQNSSNTHTICWKSHYAIIMQINS